jgi:FMNH2-dependent dimethyl sulfone monooxygenase
MTVFGTVHAPLFPPLIASKMIVTADHIGAGRFGLNIVCGHNEGEFEMFGATGSDHAARYRQGQEWIDVLRATWSREDFDVDGEFFTLRGVREKSKPYGDSFPLTMNAGTSGDGRAFALRNCDAWFTTLNTPTLNPADIHAVAERVNEAKAEAGASGREIEAYTVGIVICRPTRKEAQEYHHYVAFEYADWEAIDAILKMRGLDTGTPEQIQQRRQAQANGMGGVPFIGSPDEIAAYLAGLSQAGFRGCGISMVNYADEFPYFRDEVLPRLERLKLRSAVRSF